MNYVGSIFSAVAGTIFGVVGFVVVKTFIVAQGPGSWSTAERSIIEVAVPIGLALVTFIVAFGAVTKMGGKGR